MVPVLRKQCKIKQVVLTVRNDLNVWIKARLCNAWLTAATVATSSNYRMIHIKFPFISQYLRVLCWLLPSIHPSTHPSIYPSIHPPLLILFGSGWWQAKQPIIFPVELEAVPGQICKPSSVSRVGNTSAGVVGIQIVLPDHLSLLLSTRRSSTPTPRSFRCLSVSPSQRALTHQANSWPLVNVGSSSVHLSP